jgi:prepilin-type N-terminal cleavage/methylation domain-containing protein
MRLRGTPTIWPTAHRRGRRGFTLIEASLTTVIIGVGFVATLQLLATGTAANVQGAATTTAINLAKNVREMSLKLPYAQVQALNGTSYAPPIDSRGQPLSDMDGWTQTVVVQPVDPDWLTVQISDPDPSALRVTATVARYGSNVCSVSWYAFEPPPP